MYNVVCNLDTETMLVLPASYTIAYWRPNIHSTYICTAIPSRLMESLNVWSGRTNNWVCIRYYTAEYSLSGPPAPLLSNEREEWLMGWFSVPLWGSKSAGLGSVGTPEDEKRDCAQL